MKRVPVETRRLTRSEAAARGVSFTSKHRVASSVKRVTANTPTFTDRQWAQSRIREREFSKAKTPKAKREARRATKETYAKDRTEIRNLKSGGTAIEFMDLTKPQLFKKLRKYRKHPVMLKFEGVKLNSGGDSGKPNANEEEQWFSASGRIDAEELLDPDNYDDFIVTEGAEESEQFGLVVYPRP